MRASNLIPDSFLQQVNENTQQVPDSDSKSISFLTLTQSNQGLTDSQSVRYKQR